VSLAKLIRTLCKDRKETSDLSVIIVSWNTRDILLNCLASVACSAGEYGVVVVDNGSQDGSTAAVRDSFPKVKIIQCAANQGYACGNMIGLRATTGRYVLFLNSDTVVPSNALHRLVAFLEQRPKAAACGPRLARADGTIQAFAFGSDPTLSYLMARTCARLGLRPPLHNWEMDEVQLVDWVSGACLLARRSALDQVAGFDERMFLYFEDNDLCLRLRRAGWQVFYNPTVSIVHIGGASPLNNALRREYYDESLRYFYAKHYTFLQGAVLRIMLPLHRRCIS
jgi:N-acetylglucosaminyl-diphospho-decaprenol L-rhamnosyltransferase